MLVCLAFVLVVVCILGGLRFLVICLIACFSCLNAWVYVFSYNLCCLVVLLCFYLFCLLRFACCGFALLI